MDADWTITDLGTILDVDICSGGISAHLGLPVPTLGSIIGIGGTTKRYRGVTDSGYVYWYSGTATPDGVSDVVILAEG